MANQVMTIPLLHNLQEYSLRAQHMLEPNVWSYLSHGDTKSNEHAFARMSVMPRPLCHLVGGHTRLNLFGQALEHPILLAPVAYQRLFHPDGEVASAMAASAQGGQMVISSLASQPIETIVQGTLQAGGQAPWFQLYWQGERNRTLRLMQRAINAGSHVIVLTVDAPVKLANLQLPDGITAVNIEEQALMTNKGSAVFDGWMTLAPTWDDLDWLRQQTDLPIVIKGLLHPADAQQAVELGCDGIIVSNHGGRVFDGAPPSLEALKHIVQRIGDDIPILFDSGIRHGRDVFVALAYGASAVLLGRPYVWGLAANSAMGVAHVIRIIRDELEMTMALCGCAHIDEIDEQKLTPSVKVG